MASGEGTEVPGPGDFKRVQLGSRTSFPEAKFSALADFQGCDFGREVFSRDATFSGQAWFGGNFGAASFDGARFEDGAGFAGAIVGGSLSLDAATIRGNFRLDGARVDGDLSLRRSKFTDRADLGPLLVGRALQLDRAVFAAPVRLQVSADRVTCTDMQYLAAADFRIRWADLLDRAAFAAPAVLSRGQNVRRFHHEGNELVSEELNEDELARRLAPSQSAPCPGGAPPSCAIRTERSRVLSVRRANVRTLVLADVDLKACRFSGAHGLDGLRLDGTNLFAEPPAGYRLTRRNVLSEEWSRRVADHQWQTSAPDSTADIRPESEGAPPWWIPDWLREQWIDELDFDDTPTARQIELTYGDLRKGQEDAMNAPGAADFYCGEMEMRRLGRGADDASDQPAGRFTRDRGEHTVLTLYCSGRALGRECSHECEPGGRSLSTASKSSRPSSVDSIASRSAGSAWPRRRS